MHRPRDYQEACIKAHFHYFMRRQGNPLFVVPTGGGKSLIIAEFVKRSIEQWPSQRFLILTHVKELIEQNHAEFVRQWGMLAPVGIYSAGLGSRETDDSVIFAGIQSVWPRLARECPHCAAAISASATDCKKCDAEVTPVEHGRDMIPQPAAERLGVFDLVLIDEAHLCPKSGMGRYRAYLQWLREKNEHLKIIGYTATPFRLEGGFLHKGSGRVFTDIAFDVPLKKLIDDEYLVNLRSKNPDETIDTRGIGTVAGDFKKGELEQAAMEGDNVILAVKEMVAVAEKESRRHWLVFACGVDHAQAILEEVRGYGVRAEMVIGDTPKEERKRIIQEAKAGEITCLVNVGVLTTGFNWPRCDLLAVMRPTQSTALYVQIMGRGMRTFAGKPDCLVLDYGENVLRHGPVNDIVVNDKAGGGGAPAMKACPDCKEILHAAVTKCPECAFEFPRAPREAAHTTKADSSSPIDFSVKARPVYKLEVEAVRYEVHWPRDEEKPKTMRVEYYCGMRTVSEWLCFEHTGFALRKAREWWMKSGGAAPAPETIYEAVDRARGGELMEPIRIGVQEDGKKYERVVSREFYDEATEHDDQEGAGTRDSPSSGRPW